MHLSVVLLVLLLVLGTAMLILSLGMRSVHRWKARHDAMARSITTFGEGGVIDLEPPVSDYHTREYWQAQRAATEAEEALRRALLIACGIDPSLPELWPMQQVQFNPRERSFILVGVHPGWTPDSGALRRCWAMGFERCQLGYTDGSVAEGDQREGLGPRLHPHSAHSVPG
jgi:hypothetical protein